MGSSLMGGSSSSSSSGYSALSPELKKMFNPFGAAINYFSLPEFGMPNTTIPGMSSKSTALPGQNTGGKGGKNGGTAPGMTDPGMGGNAGVIDRFTPMGQTDEETRALDMVGRGFAPTADSLRDDIAMQMNPFNEHVINQINRGAADQYGMFKDSMSGAGQMGSNRGILGANDIDMARRDQIGGFMQGQFNNAMGNAMTTLPSARIADSQNLFAAGTFRRGLDEMQRMVPINALQTGTGLMSPFLSGSTSQTKSSNGILPMLTQAAGTAYASDPRLKENIKPVGVENGHNVYEFNYRGEKQKFIGVMADEVQKTHPEAVVEIGGYLAVNYAAIGVEFREAV